MPELPEVETIVRSVRPGLLGRRVQHFDSLWVKNVAPSLPAVRSALAGRTVTDLSRRAKFIVFHFDDGAHLLVHLRMSGRLEWADEQPQRPQHFRARWELDNGRTLLFTDARKFGRIVHTRDFATATAGLGPEPLDRTFTAARLAAILNQRRRRLKPLLLDQSVIAGLGNIYTDEALFRAGLHPLQLSHRVNAAQAQRLHAAIRQVLRLAIRNHGTSLDWIYPDGWMQRKLAVYGRTGDPCRVCGTPIEALRVGQRGTHICPCCQPLRRENHR
jgi:formamidopyrimidine-DNA glycosylase